MGCTSFEHGCPAFHRIKLWASRATHASRFEQKKGKRRGITILPCAFSTKLIEDDGIGVRLARSEIVCCDLAGNGHQARGIQLLGTFNLVMMRSYTTYRTTRIGLDRAGSEEVREGNHSRLDVL